MEARPDYYPKLDSEEKIVPDGDRLLRTYFEVIHTSFPILDPARFSGPSRTNDPLIAVMYSLANPFCQDVPNHLNSLNAFIQQAYVEGYILDRVYSLTVRVDYQ